MKGSSIRNAAALAGFLMMFIGLGMLSIPWALAVCGFVSISAAVIGEIRA